MVNLVVIPLVISLAMFSFEGDDKHERKNVEARLEVAYVKASGNTEAETFSGKVYLSMRTGRNILFFKISGLKTTTKSEKSASKLFSEARWEYSLNDNLFVFNNMNISRDRLSGYDFRISVGPGVGYGPRGTAPGDTSTQRTRLKNKPGQGPAIASWYFQESQIKGEAKREFTQVIQAARDGAAAAISENQIPRKYEEALKQYFGRLEQSENE